MPVAANPEYLLPWFSADEHTRGTQFEDLMRWWLVAGHTMATSTGRLVKVVRWEDWSDRPGIDLGTDLVGWDEKGRLWAIQCKAYAPERLIGKSEVSQLIGDAKTGRSGQFFGRIFITTSDGYTTNAKTIAKRNDVLLLSRADLDLSAVNLPWPKSEKELRSWLAGKAPKPKTVKPKHHQKTAVAKAVAHLTSSTRGQLVMACGTGKTLTALWIKEQVVAALPEKRENARVVVLVPSISLLAQTLQAWAANRNSDWKRLAVCSDATAGSSRDENFEDMAAVDAGFEVTTDRRAIREFLRNTPGAQVIFSTYQSSAEVAAAARAEKLEFDLVICDEAHRLAGQAGKTYASVLDERAFPARRRLFMTATPKRFVVAAKKKADDAGYAVASMDDPEKFGSVAYKLPFGEAIKKGLLTDYQVVIAVTTDTRAKELLEENRFVGLDGKTMTATDLAAAIAVAKAAKRHKITRAISFHSTIKRSMQFVDTLEQICAAKLPGVPRILEAGHVDGSVSAKERQRRLDRLKEGAAGFNLLANARCLTEGVDVPSLDGVAFVDPRQSEVDIVQAVGRAIRLSPKKEIGTIIVPVVCSAEEAAEGKLDAAGHKKLRQVLWALRAHDASLAIEVDDFVFAQALSAGEGRNIGTPEKARIEFDGDDLKGFAAKIRTSILKIGSPDAEWAERYAELKAFYTKYKRWPAFGAAGVEGELATWIGHQRRARKKNKLSPERVKRLETLTDWSWDPLTDEWAIALDKVAEFYKENKHLPRKGYSGIEGSLAEWVGAQRDRYRRGVLAADRRIALERTEGWEWDPLSDKWEASLSAAVSFYAENSRWPSQVGTAQEKLLGSWVSHQRRHYSAGTLSQDRVDALERLNGWRWDEFAERWRGKLDETLSFYTLTGRWPVLSRKANKQEKSLGSWVITRRREGNLRRAGKRSPMTAEEYERLDTIAGWSWDPHADAWKTNYRQVVAFCSDVGRLPMQTATDSDERDIAKWLARQRQARKLGRLSSEQISGLEDLPGWSWDPLADAWDQNFEAVRVFRAQHKLWPLNRAAGVEGELATWVSHQRQMRKRNKLSPERVKRLESIPGWVWSAKD